MLKNKAFVVGIAGGSASGKSTIAQALAEMLERLAVHIIPMDTYFKSEGQRPRVKAPVTGIEYRDDNHPLSFDLAGLARDLQQAAASGHNIR